MKEENKVHPLKKIDWMKEETTLYRKCLVRRYVGGYGVLDQVVSAPEEVDRIIDNRDKLFPNDGLIYFDPAFNRIIEPKNTQNNDIRCQILADNLKNSTTHTSALFFKLKTLK